MVGQLVGQGRREAGHVEPPAVVLHDRHQALTGELEADRDVVVGAAVADGVGARLLDAQHDVVDQLTLRTVLVEVVAQALAGAQQVRAARRNVELESRWRWPRRCPRL